MLFCFKTFRDFLIEANYGSLQYDTRILKISDILKRDILTTLSIISLREINYSGILKNIEIDKHHKSTDSFTFDLNWVIHTNLIENDDVKIESAYAVSNKNGYRIEIFIQKPNKITGKEYRKQLKLLINSEFDAVIVHEIKHTLDYIDDKFGERHDKKYFVPKTFDQKNLSKYFSQSQEFNNFVATVITDLKKIKKKEPNISYNDAISKSIWYNNVIQYINDKKISKFKSKIVHFWYDTYENKNIQIPTKKIIGKNN